MATDEKYWPLPEGFEGPDSEHIRATHGEVIAVREWAWKTSYVLALLDSKRYGYGTLGDVIAEIRRQEQFEAITFWHLVGLVNALVEDIKQNERRLPTDLRQRFPELYAFERHEAAQEPDDVVPLPGDPPRPR